MRPLAKLTAGAAVLLALAGCVNDPKMEISTLKAPAGSADSFGEGAEALAVAPDSTRLLAEEGGFAFYAALPDDPGNGEVCLVIQTPEREHAASTCGNMHSLHPLELGTAGVKAKLAVDDYEASKELGEGWRQLHKNLLLRP